jgi:stage V sporulation protein R
MWREALPEIRRVARDLGLEVRDTEFHEVPAEELYALAATRIPGMYHHWSFGRNYEIERARHDQGRGTIYELVVNLDPAQAYLLDHNSDAEQVFVAAHVMGHVDLFGRNVYCQQQRLDIDRVLRAARERFAEYEREHGEAAVEAVIDAAHMVMWHATPVEPAPPRPAEDPPPDPYRALFPEDGPRPDRAAERFRRDRDAYRRGIGERDLLRFLIRHAPLEPWQRDVLGVVRETALYLLPQTRVKILHEGWASLWHRRILRELHAYRVSDVQDARLHALVAGHPGPLADNPYWLGLVVLEHLEAQGVDLFELARGESDRSLLGRIDEELCREEPHLAALAEEMAREPDPLGRPPWQRLRDALVARVPSLPEVEVEVEEWDMRRLVLRAPVPVDEAYARVVLSALAGLWGGQAVLVTPTQELKGGAR